MVNISVLLGDTANTEIFCGSYLGQSDYEIFTLVCAKPFRGRFVKLSARNPEFMEDTPRHLQLELCEVEVYAKLTDGMHIRCAAFQKAHFAI